MRKHAKSTISKEEREYYESFIREHEPYPEDAPEVNTFDGVWENPRDENRARATWMKLILDGEFD